MLRIDIYVPEELKARMDAVGDAVDWSQVARLAFEDSLNRMDAGTDHAVARRAIQDLVTQEGGSAERDRDIGYDAGRDWATNAADHQELERLSRFEWQDHAIPPPIGVSAAILDSRAEPERTEGFWLQYLGTGFPSESMLRGFVEGALGVWMDRGRQP